MGTLMQIIGGVFFLLNKIFFSAGERQRYKGANYQTWRIFAWISYIIGLGPWVMIFIWERNWIAASVETSGLPSMLLGLIIALRGGDTEKVPTWLKRLAFIFVPIGIGISVWDFGGFSSWNQLLELGLVIGYAIGTYQLAREKNVGYLWYVLMHVCCGTLMWLQDYKWLMWQQIVSLAFIADAYYMSCKNRELDHVE